MIAESSKEHAHRMARARDAARAAWIACKNTLDYLNRDAEPDKFAAAESACGAAFITYVKLGGKP